MSIGKKRTEPVTLRPGEPRHTSPLVRLVALAATLALVAACYVPSLSPFYTRDAVFNEPPVKGLWLYQAGAASVYEFGYGIKRRAGRGLAGPIQSTFFTVDGQIFLDTTAGKIGKEDLDINWRAHLVPVHLLFKVELGKRKLSLHPLDDKRIAALVESKEADLPHAIAGEKGKDLLFTATPEQWMAFLRRSWRDPKLWSSPPLELTPLVEEGTLVVRDGLAYAPGAREPYHGLAILFGGEQNVTRWSHYVRGVLRRVEHPDASGRTEKTEYFVGGRLVAVDRKVDDRFETEFFGSQPIEAPLPKFAKLPEAYPADGAEVVLGEGGLYRRVGATDSFSGWGIARQERDGLPRFGTFRDGRFDGEIWYWWGGDRHLETYRLGVKEGPSYRWHRNGRLASAGTYQGGRPVGDSIEWHPNGCVAVRRRHRGPGEEAAYESWHQDGTPRESGTMWGANRVGTWLFWGDDWDGPREGRYENGVLHWRAEDEKGATTPLSGQDAAPLREKSAVPKQAPAARKSEAAAAYNAAVTAVELAKKALEDSRSVVHKVELKADFAAMSADLDAQQASFGELKDLIDAGAYDLVVDRSRAIVAKADDIQAQLRSISDNLGGQPVRP